MSAELSIRHNGGAHKVRATVQTFDGVKKEWVDGPVTDLTFVNHEMHPAISPNGARIVIEAGDAFTDAEVSAQAAADAARLAAENPQ